MDHLPHTNLVARRPVGVDQLHAPAHAAARLAHGRHVGDEVAADLARVLVGVAPAIAGIPLPAHREIPARDEDRRAVVDVHALQERQRIGHDAIAHGALAVLDLRDRIVRIEHRMILAQPVNAAFRQDVVRGAESRLIESPGCRPGS